MNADFRRRRDAEMREETGDGLQFVQRLAKAFSGLFHFVAPEVSVGFLDFLKRGHDTCLVTRVAC